MATVQPQFRIRQLEGYGGNFTDSDYLAASFDAGKPHEFDNVMGTIFSASDRFAGKPLHGMTQARNKVTYIDSGKDVYRWWMDGFDEKFLRVVENVDSAVVQPGIGNTTFRIKLDEPWYERPDVIQGEDNNYSLAILAGPTPDGEGYIYEVQGQWNDPNKFFPPELMEVGREFSKVWTSTANEFNQDYGTHQVQAPFQLQSQLGYFAEKYQVTDKAWRTKAAIPIKYRDKNGKVQKTEKIMNLEEAKMWNSFYMGQEAQMWYGEMSNRTFSPEGYPIRTSPGLRQILRDGNTEYYNGVLTEQMLQDYLLDIFFARKNEEERRVTFMTGTGGSMVFHELLAAAAGSFLTVDNHWIQSLGTGNHLSYGAQFTHYRGLEGIEVTLVKNPLYDDRKYCKQMHPTQVDKPIDSYRFTVLDFGMSDGQDNISMIKEKGYYGFGYVNGTWTPTGAVQGGSTSNLVAGYTAYAFGSCGLWVKDPSRCGELILDTN